MHSASSAPPYGEASAEADQTGLPEKTGSEKEKGALHEIFGVRNDALVRLP
jgi:hypothetical protein